MKIFLSFSFLIVSKQVLAADNCLGLNEVCNADCDCCGHPDNKAIRCEKRGIKDDKKRCHEARVLSGPCLDSIHCLSQNCVNGVCLPPLKPHDVGKVGICSLGNSTDIVEAVNGHLPECACIKPATDSLTLAMDGDLSTDYTNFHSKDNSGLIFKPSFSSPLKEMEVCTSNQNMANDPLCYSIYGECKHKEGEYDLIHHGDLRLPAQRRRCVKLAIGGRLSHSRYKLIFGCRRGGFDATCRSDDVSAGGEPGTSGEPGAGGEVSSEPSCDSSKASCQEVTPKGKDETCVPLHNRNGARSFSNFFPHSIDYDDANDVTRHTYSFLNKIGDCKRKPDLSHAVFQYAGACCVSKIRVYAIENDVEVTYYTSNSPGGHLQSPKPTVCMSGIDLPGVEGAKTYYYEFSIDGYFPKTTLVDYVLKGGRYVKYSRVQGPDCRCSVRRALADKRMFRGLPLDATSRKRRLACDDKPVSISEVILRGKCNEG